MLKVSNITSGYKKNIDVVSDISFDLEQGEVLVILGKNGAGKSTILKTILSLIKLRSGEIYLNEKNYKEISISNKAKLISYVPQNVVLPPLSVYDTILSSRLSYYFLNPSPSDYAKVDEVLNELAIDSLKDKSASDLSGGECQLVAIARSLAQEPKIIIFDEPNSNLDILNVSLLRNTIRKVRKKGISCIIALHDLNIAYDLGDKFLFLKDGKTVAYGNKDIFTSDNIYNTYDAKLVMKEIDGELFIKLKENDDE